MRAEGIPHEGASHAKDAAAAPLTAAPQGEVPSPGADSAPPSSPLAVVGDNAGFVLGLLQGGPGGGLPAPFSEPILLVERTRVAGTTHVPGIRAQAARLSKGERLSLVRDPKNSHDRWAIRVLDAQGERLGFVPADCNEVLARLMDAGKHLYAQVRGVEMRDSWVRVGMDIYLDD